MKKLLLSLLLVSFICNLSYAQIIKEQVVRNQDTLWLILKKDVNRLLDKMDSMQAVVDITDEQVAVHKLQADSLKLKSSLLESIVDDYRTKDGSYEKQIEACEDRATKAEKSANSEQTKARIWRIVSLVGIPVALVVGLLLP